MTPAPSLLELAERLQQAMLAPQVAEEAALRLSQCREVGLESDWEGCPKVDDFTRLVVAAARLLPPGGSIETGVYRGGTSGPLMLVAPPDSFHVSVDPFGLPSQSYPLLEYRRWSDVRRTLARLAALGERRGVTYCHYLTDSLTFVRGDLLPRPAQFRFIHLDGDHSFEVVRQELAYFRTRIVGPALFILDDHDDHFPGVEAAMLEQGEGMARVLHRFYDFPNYGVAGFSAWLHAH